MVNTVRRRQLKNKRTKRRTRKGGVNFTSSLKRSIGLAYGVNKTVLGRIFEDANLNAHFTQEDANRIKKNFTNGGLMTQMVKIFVILDKNGRMITKEGNIHPREQELIMHGNAKGNLI
uniref:Uncharacterized protein n=1 Tax=viral metagenome TaxID=1070528 RepID=A0A6C0BRT3_9ZZZZ